MKKILIAYDSKDGQTKKIAEFIKEELQKNCWWVDIMNSRFPVTPIEIEQYDGVIVGGPVHASRYPKSLKFWVRRHADILSKKPSAFFSVCLGILQPGGDIKEQEEHIVNKFLKWTGWTPGATAIFAGAVKYTRYNWFTKWVMRHIVKKSGGSTDTSKDYEYTNWNEVRAFSEMFIARI